MTDQLPRTVVIAHSRPEADTATRKRGTRVVTVAEAARLLGTSPQTMRTLLRKGELPGRKRPEGGHDRWDVSRPELERFVADYGASTVTGASETHGPLRYW
jgi:excisionase family DNA binding protein